MDVFVRITKGVWQNFCNLSGFQMVRHPDFRSHLKYGPFANQPLFDVFEIWTSLDFRSQCSANKYSHIIHFLTSYIKSLLVFIFILKFKHPLSMVKCRVEFWIPGYSGCQMVKICGVHQWLEFLMAFQIWTFKCHPKSGLFSWYLMFFS